MPNAAAQSSASPGGVSIANVELIVGMEVHVELATRTRMFSRTANIAHPDNFDAEPNSLIDPVVLGLPGSLPVMNLAAVEMSILVGLALNCEIATLSRWDRKNYFYPDLPKGYQISQYELPLCFDGELNVHVGDAAKRIGIIRAHLEEDAGKISHELPGGGAAIGSLIDYNRAGTPLLEIVSAPDLRSSDEAVAYGQELRSICRFLGVTEGVMQRGHMRFEPNINLRITTADGRLYETPIVEVKNLNSFKSLRGAIEHERTRQIEQWRRDGLTNGPGRKSTRGWDDVRECTTLQRDKEDAHDYRYFPDPDLPPVRVSEAWRDDLRARLPELPAARRTRYQNDYALSAVEASTLTADFALCSYFEACVEALSARLLSCGSHANAGGLAAKWLLNAGAKRANEREVTIDQLGITPAQVAQVIEMRERDVIGSNAADELFGIICDGACGDIDIESLATERGLVQVRDDVALDRWVSEAIAAQPQAAQDYAAGKDAALGRLTGHIMRSSKGRANAAAAQAKLKQRLRD